MTIEEIILEKAARLESVPDAFLSSVEKLQKSIFKTILKYVGQLERDGDKIIASETNFKIASQITDELKKVIVGKDYVSAVTQFAKQFDNQAILSDKYFKKEFKDFKESELADAVLQNAKRETVATLIDTTPKTKFIDPLKGILDQNISAGAGYTEMVQSLQTYALGNGEVDGKLLSYSKQIAHDSFAIADRSYTNVISNELGIEFYQYFGGLVKDSREFCTVRHGKFYHYKEVEAWAEMAEWAGRMQYQQAYDLYFGRGVWLPPQRLAAFIIFRSKVRCTQEYLKRKLQTNQ